MYVFHALRNGGKSILPPKMKSLSPKLLVMIETKRGGANKTHEYQATQVATKQPFCVTETRRNNFAFVSFAASFLQNEN